MIILPASMTMIEPPLTAVPALSVGRLYTSSDILSFLEKVIAVFVRKAGIDILRFPNK